MRVVATKSPLGDLVIIATDVGVWEIWKLYKLRWSVECTFGSSKSRGFDLERTGMTDLKRLERLFGLVTLAWLNCLRIGVWKQPVKPIKVLAHRRKDMSLVRYGSEHLRNALRWDPGGLVELFALLILPFSAPGAACPEDVRYRAHEHQKVGAAFPQHQRISTKRMAQDEAFFTNSLPCRLNMCKNSV
ncbi:transposase [Deinococcus sp. KNUC1210]|uniref:transposase n=1 Tax=Deinococcus sp. KNUC1210 TaxID=2917691 RepID=UPI00351CE0F6